MSGVLASLEHEAACVQQGPDGKRSWHNILEAAGKTRPTLLETVYGLDVIIPGQQTLASAMLYHSHC